MNICNFEIHNNCGFYSSSDDVAIKKIDRRSASDVLFVEEKLTYSKLLFVIEGVVKIKINKLDVQVIVQEVSAWCRAILTLSVQLSRGHWCCRWHLARKSRFARAIRWST